MRETAAELGRRAVSPVTLVEHQNNQWPPSHPMCRCVLTPYPETFAPAGWLRRLIKWLRRK